MIPLTNSQAKALAIIREANAHGSSPSYAEMRADLGLSSKSGVHRLVLALEQRGAIRRLPGRARTIEVVDGPRTREEVCAALAHLSAINLRHVIACAAGLAAHRDGDGGGLMAEALRRIADRLTGQPRRSAA